jgi:hypothetical protein
VKLVKVFKANVQDHTEARHIVFVLHQTFSSCIANFDLDDCDRILRIETQGESIHDSDIQLLIAAYGYFCEPLAD